MGIVLSVPLSEPMSMPIRAVGWAAPACNTAAQHTSPSHHEWRPLAPHMDVPRWIYAARRGMPRVAPRRSRIITCWHVKIYTCSTPVGCASLAQSAAPTRPRADGNPAARAWALRGRVAVRLRAGRRLHLAARLHAHVAPTTSRRRATAGVFPPWIHGSPGCGPAPPVRCGAGAANAAIRPACSARTACTARASAARAIPAAGEPTSGPGCRLQRPAHDP